MAAIDLMESRQGLGTGNGAERAHSAADPVDPQSFSPALREKPKVPFRGHRVKLVSLENLPKFAKNRYEGVLIASARARQLNSKKVALEERGMMDEAQELKRMKMTSFALNELVEGKINVTRPNLEA
jgi:DNA-directed RNA polymerase omega subunit